MRRQLTADAVAALLLLGAASALVATPYDGGACRNVASAYALPPAKVEAAVPPAEPAALGAARADVQAAEGGIAALGDERAAAQEAETAAQQARAAASEARSAAWDTSSTTPSPGVTDFDVEMARSSVQSAETWLQIVEDGAAEASEYSVWTGQDVAEAQDDLDAARDELAATEQALADARSQQAASEAAEAAAASERERLEAAADAAERAADEAAGTLAAAEDDAEAQLAAAQARVSGLESRHEMAHAEWSHEQRLAGDAVVARNNVRGSCRENGAWRAGMALVDVALLVALGLRALRPGSLRLRR